MYPQIVDSLNNGVVVIDHDMRILVWNRWMQQHSGLGQDQVINKKIDQLFPEIVKKGFIWKVKNVFKLGNFAFFSQELHQYLLRFPAPRYLNSGFENMQQSVVISPIKGPGREVGQVLVSITDETDAVLLRQRLKKANERLEELSRIDHLTQVPNRRYLVERLEQELSRHQREGKDLSLAILDIDYFKKINDSHGHLCGDRALAELAALVRGCLRQYDMVGRYGGEEFCIIFPGAGIQAARGVLTRVREALKETMFRWEDKHFKMTVSVGLASTSERPEIGADALLKLADEALYQAKETGRDRIVESAPDRVLRGCPKAYNAATVSARRTGQNRKLNPPHQTTPQPSKRTAAPGVTRFVRYR